MSNDNLKYSGKPEELTRTIGDGTLPSNRIIKSKDTNNSRDFLLQTLDEIQILTSEIIANVKLSMRDVAVVIPEHSALNKAKDQEWPNELSATKNTIGYDFYLAMKAKNTSGSTYLQSYYKDNISKSKHAAHLEINDISQIIFDESKRIENFVHKYIGDTVGSEKTATIRLLQEWADYSLEIARSFWSIESKSEKEMLSTITTTNMDKVSAEESKQLQALFQGKINAVNTVISSDLEAIKKSHGFLSDRFYEEHLGPALKIRSEVIGSLEKIQPSIGTPVKKDVKSSTNVYNSNFKVALSDQMVRNRVFIDHVENTLSNLIVRDKYIDTIDKLSVFGSPATPQVVKDEPTKEEIDFFQSYTGTDEDIFKASHKYLDDTLDPDAHPQYLLKEGGEIAGDISVKEGVTIDGVQISSHKHNGTDGSERIDATDLVPGSLEIASINRDEIVVKPEALRFVASKTMLNASTALMDATFEWRGERDNSFEIQIAPVETVLPPDLMPIYTFKKAAVGDPIPEYPPDVNTVWGGKVPTLQTVDGNTWFCFLSPDEDENSIPNFNALGRNFVESATTLQLAISSSTSDSALFYDTISDTDFVRDEKLKYPLLTSSMWVLRAGEVAASYYDEDIIMCFGNKVWLIMGESEGATPDFSVASVLKEFPVDETNSADIYFMALDKSDNSVYFFVKLSQYAETRIASSDTTIELWKISANNEFEKLFMWENEQIYDRKERETGRLEWYTNNEVGEKDYIFMEVGTVYDGFIYGWSPIEYKPVALKFGSLVPQLSKFDLSTFTKEPVSIENIDSPVYCSDVILTRPIPVIKDGVIYLPGIVQTFTEVFDITNPKESVVTIKDGIFKRHILKTTGLSGTALLFLHVISDTDDNIYGLCATNSYLSPGGSVAAIYRLEDLDV